jgi:protein involved in polysaccharide export with SLBB domain
LIPFNLGGAVVEGVESENVSLLPGDTVTIFSQGDIAVSVEKQSKFVRVEGEVWAPGIYRVEAGETLRDVVKRAGGLTYHAYLFATSLTRDSVRQDQQRSLDEMVRSLEVEVQRKAVTASTGAPQEEATRFTQIQAAQTLVEKLRNAKATGRVILEIQPTDASASEIPALPLEDGDRVVIPFHSSTVTVVGAVYNQSSFVYKDGSSLKRYLGLAGNGTRDADTKHMFVVRADGTVVSREQMSGVWGGGFESLKALPGDLIVVPTQIERGRFMRSLKEWSQVIGQFGLGAAAVYVLAK